MRVSLTEKQGNAIISYNSKKWGLLKAPAEMMVYKDQSGVYLNPAPGVEMEEPRPTLEKKCFCTEMEWEPAGTYVGACGTCGDFFEVRIAERRPDIQPTN